MNAAGSMYVIDAFALIYQMFHAIPPMSSSDGRPTNAVFGVARDLLWLHQEVKPDYLLCAFDLPGPTFRDEIAPEYKKNRPPPPPDLPPQIDMIRDLLTAMNLPILSAVNYEADDVMATLARAGSERGLNVYLCTSDKDCRQLLNDHVRIYNLRKREEVNAARLMEIWGVKPEQVVNFQTLVGDSIDNVAGVPGVGEKTAAKLLKEYESLDNLVKNVGTMKKSKLKENLEAAIASGHLERSRSLVRLDQHVPLEFDWDGWRCGEWNSTELLALFQAYGFRSFAQQVRSGAKAEGASRNAAMLEEIGEAPKPKQKPAKQGADLFSSLDDTPAPEPPPPGNWQATYTNIDTPGAFQTFLSSLKQQKRFAFDLETTGLDPLQSLVVGVAFAWQEGEAFYLPLRAPAGDAQLDPSTTLDALRPIFADPTVGKVNQNIKYDMLALRAAGVEVRGVVGDSMIARYLLKPGERSYGIDDLTLEFFGHQKIPTIELIGKGKNRKTMDQLPAAQVGHYACEDADAAWRLTQKLEGDLDPTLRKLYDEVEVPLITALADIEFTGIRLDVPFLDKLSVEMGQQLVEIEKKIHDAVDRKFNIASPKQMREVLFEQLKLPIQKRTGTTNEPSTDQESLEKLARLDVEKYPQAQVAVAIVEHRQVSKLKGTYVDALPNLVNPKTDRVHTSFNQTMAETGRLSSSDPNLQNIPIRTTQGQQIRKAFLPKEGWLLLSADYSQVELRLLAHFCKDVSLRQAFVEDRDIHASVAADIYKVALDDVSSEQRRMAKTINFGVIYGMSAFGLAERLNIPRHDAEEFIDAYFHRYPKVLEYQDNLLKTCRGNGYVATILGRRRKFSRDDISEKPNYRGRKMIDRQAINMEIQGSAADLMKLAILNVQRRLAKEKLEAQMLLTVHDELVFEFPMAEQDALTELVKHEMENAIALEVPLKVDAAVGINWLETK